MPMIVRRNRDTPASPQDQNQYGGPAHIFCGLTKREAAAFAAMQGMVASGERLMEDTSAHFVAQCAVIQADALFDELEKRDDQE